MEDKSNSRISMLLVATTILLFTYSTPLSTQYAFASKSQDSAAQVRMRWQDFIGGPEGSKRLASLQAGVARMKSLDNSSPDSADFRRSWKYWPNIHGYLGPKSRFGTVASQIDRLKKLNYPQFIPYIQGIADQVPPDSIAETVWATCEHSRSQEQQANFFGWHRMYLYYFERVLRWAANDDALRLPYWDYTDPTKTGLPDAFQDTNSVFYDWRRAQGLNEGSVVMNPNITDVDSDFAAADFLTFEWAVESGVHGNVHCAVGQTCPVADMGLVPVAANDPVFYVHHANIDRLWACWENEYATQPASWQDQKFSFVDETGALQTKPVKDFLDTAALGYVYDNVSQCTRSKVIKTVLLQGSTLQGTPPGERYPAMLASTKTIHITEASTSVNIPLRASKMRSLAVSPAGSTASELVLRDITAESEPGTMLDVYISKTGEPANRKYVGTINWFGAFEHREAMTGPDRKTLKFDITTQLKTLELSADTPGLTVTFEASNGRVPNKPSEVPPQNARAEQSFRPDANVQIGTIEFRQVTISSQPQKR
jgi:hypothetical protein